ncbi:MAG: hypothetical protein F2555_03295 [Actinobacteria bacterium]|nr:hypothetical protein [Actinomycetota bacterium]
MGVGSCGLTSITSGQLDNQVGFFLSAAFTEVSELKINANMVRAKSEYRFIFTP